MADMQRPLATMSRQISRDCVSRVISLNDVVTPPISPPSFWGPSLTHESPAETPTADETIGQTPPPLTPLLRTSLSNYPWLV
ncbi:hypothetical protein Aperf_G00000131599 [Anoplocephala perfoliata]